MMPVPQPWDSQRPLDLFLPAQVQTVPPAQGIRPWRETSLPRPASMRSRECRVKHPLPAPNFPPRSLVSVLQFSRKSGLRGMHRANSSESVRCRQDRPPLNPGLGNSAQATPGAVRTPSAAPLRQRKLVQWEDGIPPREALPLFRELNDALRRLRLRPLYFARKPRTSRLPRPPAGRPKCDPAGFSPSLSAGLAGRMVSSEFRRRLRAALRVHPVDQTLPRGAQPARRRSANLS